ncbi:MAG: iron export ABC transporter permease subunit FetB [Thermaerobacter sp.]|nr:iron export ABC transporter permease subunit FetB [Thermaerobacter sp.]
MTLLTLSFTLGFVVVALLLSLWLKLGLERDLVIATIRSAIQLIAIGYILKIVFKLNNPLFIVLMIALMVGVATQNAARRGQGLAGVWWKILIAIAITECVTQGLLVGFRITPWAPKFVIPISGMIVGNAMIASGLLLNRLKSEARGHHQEIRAILALGGTPKQAIMPFLKQAIRASMIPTIDSAKTTGLVQLPGMMTGQIIAGADPIQAVRYQLLILFSFMASAAITSIVLGFVTYPSLFSQYQQLVVTPD